MLKSTKLIAAAAVVGVVILGGGGAFTASNNLPSSKVGYGESTVTGATISSINYTLDSQDASKLGSVVFTAVNQFANSNGNNDPTAQLTLKNAGVFVESDTCTVNTASSITTISCNASGAPLINSFDQTGLTIVGP